MGMGNWRVAGGRSSHVLEHIAHMRRVARFVSDSRVFLLTTRNAHAMPPPSDFVTYYFTISLVRRIPSIASTGINDVDNHKSARRENRKWNKWWFKISVCPCCDLCRNMNILSYICRKGPTSDQVWTFSTLARTRAKQDGRIDGRRPTCA